MSRILFLCTNDSCRSQMAEGFSRARGEPGVEILRAGDELQEVHPLAVRVMGESGVDISANTAVPLAQLDGLEFDVVVTMQGGGAAAPAMLPGNPERVDWGLPDPAAVEGDEETTLATFRRARDRIRGLVDDFFDRGYLAALMSAKRCQNTILNTISDGIIAHDLDRRIVFFNNAAQEITGFSRAEVMNRDCHEVFPGNFCGGKCAFCDGAESPEFDVRRQEMTIAAKGGDRRTVEAVIRPMRDGSEGRVGVLVSFRDLTREKRLARRVGAVQQFCGIIGRDEKMLELFDLIRDLAETNVPVLIQGDSGTGKELVAAAIHNEGPRANRLFVPVNCGALPETLLESELFGHVKGAFTGAIRDKKGRFELADQGTIFLDEIGDISPAMQVKLMRVVQEGTFERVGSEQTLRVDVRVISATNKDLSAEIAAGRFRDDLYYRLSVVPLWLPALRERRNDIPLLVDHILQHALEDSGRSGVTLSPDALDLMFSYDWPGNVRELQNWIQFALVKCKESVIRPEHLPPSRPGPIVSATRRRRRKLDPESVREALRRTGGNKVEAARVLGVSRATLYRFLGDLAGAL